jgi:hypothetical protein
LIAVIGIFLLPFGQGTLRSGTYGRQARPF